MGIFPEPPAIHYLREEAIGSQEIHAYIIQVEILDTEFHHSTDTGPTQYSKNTNEIVALALYYYHIPIQDQELPEGTEASHSCEWCEKFVNH